MRSGLIPAFVGSLPPIHKMALFGTIWHSSRGDSLPISFSIKDLWKFPGFNDTLAADRSIDDSNHEGIDDRRTAASRGVLASSEAPAPRPGTTAELVIHTTNGVFRPDNTAGSSMNQIIPSPGAGSTRSLPKRVLAHSGNEIGDLASAQSPVDRVQRCQRYQRLQRPLCVRSLLSFCHLYASAPYIANFRENRTSGSENWK
jgi:hypothetical protein